MLDEGTSAFKVVYTCHGDESCVIIWQGSQLSPPEGERHIFCHHLLTRRSNASYTQAHAAVVCLLNRSGAWLQTQ